MNVPVEDIVYLHCHNHKSGGTVVMIGQDGVHKSPITFPRGGHLLAFLSCLETGLAPFGQLDPPLWSQKGKGLYTNSFNICKPIKVLELTYKYI